MQIWHQHVVSLDLDIHTSISLRSHDQEALEHELRDAWRAEQWSLFIKSCSKAAQTLSHLNWPQVRQRFNLARSTLQDAERRPHLLAIYTNHWVSSHWPQGLARLGLFLNTLEWITNTDTLSWINGSPSTATWSLYAMVAGGQGGIIITVIIISIIIIIVSI